MDIPPTNQFVSLEKMETFIEKYPEDAEKWLEFLEDTRETNTIYPYKRRIRNEEDLNQEILKEQTEILEEPNGPITHFSEGCLFCKKSWTQTNDVPSTTLICGHKYHTICYMYNHYHNDTVQCIVDDCDINTWDYVKQIGKMKRKNAESVENIIVDSITKRKDFKEDLKEFKALISDVTKKHSSVRKSLTDARNELINKHIFSINQIQSDMNDLVKVVSTGEQMETYKTSLRVYRKKAKNIFRKYHLSFRDLERRKKIKVSWRLRWILERHRESFGYYKLGLRMYPGKKIWNDPLTTEGPVDPADTERDLESDGTED
jgi:predicted nucleotidyltransferase